MRSSGRWKEKNWCILKSLALIICVGISRGELSDEGEFRSLDVKLPLLEPSEVLEPTPLLCDAECCTGGAWGSVVDGEALLLGCGAHWTPVCLLSTDGSALVDEECVGTPALPATTAAFGGLAELKYLPPPDLDEK